VKRSVRPSECSVLFRGGITIVKQVTNIFTFGPGLKGKKDSTSPPRRSADFCRHAGQRDNLQQKRELQ